ncbi:hypothetical protein RN001_014957 [Aquatica leii]|uniref:RZ-type domain-containing protein n=1 Tax=Aquatica leii TaxID=1421715 RepID=A0AAN7QC75_9COLE|nr:hypothetical protein RN001_014957 [Aquatica leii]
MANPSASTEMFFLKQQTVFGGNSSPNKRKFRKRTRFWSRFHDKRQRQGNVNWEKNVLNNSKNNNSKLKRKHEELQSVGSYKKRKLDKDVRYRFKNLEELSEKDSTAIILELRGREDALKALFDSKMSNDAIVLVFQILAKVCLTDLLNVYAILKILAYKPIFFKSLEVFILELTVQSLDDRKRSSYFWRNRKAFLSNCAIVFRSLIKSIPSKAYEVLPRTLKAFTVMFTSLSWEVVDEEVLNTFGELERMLVTFKLERPKEVEKPSVKDKYSNLDPPDNFRSLNIYPNREDVLSPEGFLRKNLIDKSYQNVNHYLDVQFRLLKEDFVGPLRRGIGDYMKYRGAPKEIMKTSDVIIYSSVRFVSPITVNGQLGVLLQFQSPNQRRRYRNNLNKRFMYGSLLCFTKDKFQSLLFAKVLDRNTKLLQKGQVIVGFEFEQDKYLLEQSYVMVECSVYFEPYYHVLKALQNMNEAEFPMKKYIIDLNRNINAVSYLNPTSTYTILNKSVTVNNFAKWPNADALNLNTTQYQAFRTALTKELVVIQGPPGTGKTFLGLKIAKTLIDNKKHWYKSSPMLVVCYTNHALDQFLEGLQDTTLDIVRVGGQSKNKNMEKFSLREKGKLYAFRKNNKALIAVEQKVYGCLKLIKRCNGILKDIESNSVVINFKEFKVIDGNIPSWFFTATDQELVDWLVNGIIRNSTVQLQQVRNVGEVENDLHDEFSEIQSNLFRREHELNVEIDFVLDDNSDHCLTSVSKLTSRINEIKEELDSLKLPINDQLDYKILTLEDERSKIVTELHKLKTQLNHYEKVQVHERPHYSNPHMMYSENRWQLYLYWLGQYQQHLIHKLIELQDEYKIIYKQYKEIRDIIDLEVMKQALVVGMTTTCAARLQTIIKNLKSPIVIVEEAAEVLESHVVVSLTSLCKHLILIGDHQQLKPSTSNYFLEKRFNFGISLFERMVLNNFHSHILGVQHRMRPEFANLIVPAIYQKLENHDSVLNLPSIAGIAKNLYFIDHKFQEKEHNDRGQLNDHEAKFLIALARYLIQNGYKPEDITILAAYSAQMFTLWKEQKKCLNLLEGVRITVLDNYQGKESKIILLSLVRNNTKGKIGFLKIENRVCVALSRAKEGFYMMGNIDLLSRNSKTWKKIKNVLKSQDSLGTSLLLRCQIHPDQETSVTIPDDFNNVPEGGCSKTCGARLMCGHYCTMICHVLNRKHEDFKCIAKCTKTCLSGHKCHNLCYEQCKPCKILMNRTLPCTHEHKLYCYADINNFKCPTFVEATLPCGHVHPEKPCHQSVETHKCPFRCKTRVDSCGHACLKKCHFTDDPDHIKYKCRKPCQKLRFGCSTREHKCPNLCFEECAPCEIVIEKTRTCKHKTLTFCNRNADDSVCDKPCERLLPYCRHPCKKKCNELCGDCDVMVLQKVRECGHTIKMKCSQVPSRQLCYEKCTLSLACGHACENRCNEPCTTSCKVLVDHTTPTDCGHKFKIECHMLKKNYASNSLDLLKYCDSPCGTTLSCTHVCSGTCGECSQGRIHKACSEKCGTVLVCGHICPINCSNACRPCEILCTFKCRHSESKKQCWESCTKCTEKCLRKCPHIECLALCGDTCTVPPCNEPCPKKLSCGHSCIGFCGDPCPTLCRVCNLEELAQLDSWDEDEDARFVVLDECSHVIESSYMEAWLQQNLDFMGPKRCPSCNTILQSTQRYSDQIKKALFNISMVRRKLKNYGSHSEIEIRRTDLLIKVNELKRERKLMNGSMFNTVLESLETVIQPIRNGCKQPLNLGVSTVYLQKLQILENIVRVYKKGNIKTNELVKNVNFLFSALLKNPKQLSKQELTDLEREVKRFAFMVQLNQIRESQYFSHFSSRREFLDAFEDIKTILFSIEKFTESLETSVVEKLDYLSKTFNVEVLKIELDEVIRAMNLPKGHWYQCPNGHLYTIGECGGARQTGKCIDCSEGIGGTNHTLLPNNSHSSVDGSRYAAYSEEANNLFNYEEFRNF